MKKHLQLRSSAGAPLLASLLAATLLVACGGGSDSVANGGGSDPGGGAGTPPPAAASEIPSSATASAAGAFDFVNGVASMPNNTAEPLVTGNEVLATSDTTEPDPRS